MVSFQGFYSKLSIDSRGIMPTDNENEAGIFFFLLLFFVAGIHLTQTTVEQIQGPAARQPFDKSQKAPCISRHPDIQLTLQCTEDWQEVQNLI